MGSRFHGVLAFVLSEGTSTGDCARIDVEPEDLLELLRSREGRRELKQRCGVDAGPVDWDAYEAQLRDIDRTRTGVVCAWDREYPASLREIRDAPALLFYRGSLSALGRLAVAVVGTRKPSPGGTAFARKLGRDIALTGTPVASGLARGIDTAAHLGSMEGPGMPVAVIGTGVDVPYPPENAELMVELAEKGCVVSEQLMGMGADRWVFPKRNRLISGMSRAVVVVEGGQRSGALITARWALEQGRDVGAVPGFPGDFRSAGPNRLLRNGAFLVEGVGDILDAVPLLRAELLAERDDGAGAIPDEQRGVFDAMGTTPVDADAVARALGQSIEDVQRSLLNLEIGGYVARDAAGRYVRTGDGA